MNKNFLLAPAGWEDRYYKGTIIDIDEFNPSKIWVPYSNEYLERTKPFRDRIQKIAEKRNIEYVESAHDYHDSISLYKSLLLEFQKQLTSESIVRFHATTTPRDMIWYLLHFLSEIKISTEFSYFRPIKYGNYLSRDAKSPNLVLKRSGIAYPDLPTCILVLSGYDEERLSQLKQRYEPKLMLVGHQVGDQLENKLRNVFGVEEPTDSDMFFDFNCFDTSDESVQVLCEKIDSLSQSHNILAASLGPKPSALILFKLTESRPEVGLVYIAANDYSIEYSSGIDLTNRTLSKVF